MNSVALTTALIAATCVTVGVSRVRIDGGPATTLLPATSIEEVVVYGISGEAFAPPVQVSAEQSGPFPESSAEQAAFQVLRSITIQDHEAWMKSWDSAGQTFYAARDHGSVAGFGQQTKENRLAAWRSMVEEAQVYIVARLVTQDFTVVAFEIRKSRATAPIGEPGFGMKFDEDGVLRGRVLLSMESGQWKQSGRFAGHPVALLWHTKNTTTRRPAKPRDWSATTPWPPK